MSETEILHGEGRNDLGRSRQGPSTHDCFVGKQFFIDFESIQAIYARGRPFGHNAFPIIARTDRCSVVCNA